jgi:hypothetical protein
VNEFVLIIIAASCSVAAMFLRDDSIVLIMIGVVALTLLSALTNIERRLQALEANTADPATRPE